MLKWIACLLAVAALILAPVPAQAKAKNEKKPHATPEEVFKKLDKDGDGKLSLAEFVGKAKGAKAEKKETVFKAKDADNDSSLTLDEFKTKVKKNKKDS